MRATREAEAEALNARRQAVRSTAAEDLRAAAGAAAKIEPGQRHGAVVVARDGATARVALTHAPGVWGEIAGEGEGLAQARRSKWRCRGGTRAPGRSRWRSRERSDRSEGGRRRRTRDHHAHPMGDGGRGLTWAGRLEEREQKRTRKMVLAITAATAGTGASSILAILAHGAGTGASAAELVDRAAWAGITVSLMALAAYGWAWLKA